MDRTAAYAQLGLPPSATSDQIRHAYRRAAQRWHPDRHPTDPSAQERFVRIQVAYRLLLKAPLRASSTPAASAAPTLRVTGDDAHVRLLVPLASVFAPQQGQVCVRVARTCPRCAGQAPACPQCHGTGQVFVEQILALQVPAGAVPGQVIRLVGQGHSGPHFTEPGDVCVEIVWSRRGAWHYREGRLERRIRLPRRLQHAGGTWRLRTPQGRRGHLTLPPTPRHHWVCVPGQGLPRPDGQRDPLWLWVL